MKSLLVGFREDSIELQRPGFCAANLLEVGSLRVQSLWLLKKLYPQGRSQSIVNS